MGYLKEINFKDEKPPEYGWYYTYETGKPSCKKWDPEFPDTWKDVKYWYKEVSEKEMLSDDLKQYMTNLLYYAHDTANFSSTDFDKWVEEMINGIDEYFKSLSPKEDNSHNNEKVEVCTKCNDSIFVNQFSREVRISKCVKCGK